ncbi:MAG: M20 aminoacylase family protein [Pseudomonadota bacterium]
MDTTLEQSMLGWRRQLHRIPELGFEEKRTSDYVATLLQALGLEVARGVGGTGIVASLRCGSGTRAIGLRADMDALAIHEAAPARAHASQSPGRMHACGHDGHMAMVLGAAHMLARARDFDGTVRFIFQPAEEHGRGAAAMLADGLLARFPIDEIYGVHNMPGMPLGRIATRAGGIMGSEDNFVIKVTGKGGHAARPHTGVDPLVCAAHIVVALQTVVSRAVDPAESAVVSCTEFITDGIRNAIPTHVTIKGDTRSYAPAVQARLQERMRAICEGVAAAHGATVEFDYTHEFAPTVNWPQRVPDVVAAAQAVVGAENVDADTPPQMISEDFGAFLREVPGVFCFLGNGVAGEEGGIPLHNAGYDFNDRLLGTGARFLAQIARTRLVK